MKTIQITEENALAAYKSANDSEKKLLTTLFGKEFIKPVVSIKSIKTIEDAIAAYGGLDYDEKILFDYSGTNKNLIAARANMLLSIVAKVLNGDWQPDWTNHNQNKYYPFFEKKQTGSAFSFGGYGSGYSYAGTYVGSRLCFKDRETAEYVGKQFIKEYNELMEI